MNVAIIFAGGVGKRMGDVEKPKQFMEIDGKPIIIHTIEAFEKNKNIDGIIVATLKEWIEYLEDLLKKYNITKVSKIVPGGETGQMSIFNGINAANQLYPEDTIVLIHDGVRPFIDDELINKNIESVKLNGTAISCVCATETLAIVNEDKEVREIPKRDNALIMKAPQSFYLRDIYNVHIKAQNDEIYSSIDSATLSNMYGKKLSVVMTDYDNIKITTIKDIKLAESIYARKKGK